MRLGLRQIFVIVLLSAWVTGANAEEAGFMADLKTKLRPLVEKHLGEDIAIKLFGNLPAEVELPAIPTVVKDAKSTAVYEKEETIGGVKLDEKKAQKYNYAFLNELYLAVRSTKPNQNEMAKWMNVMNQGATREGVYRALVLDSTYLGLENFERPTSNRGAEFANYFLGRFISQNVNKGALEKMNFYTVKRVTTEKALDIIDSYKSKDDMYKWYAVMSGELAARYPEVWNSSIRKDKSMARHLNWASNVPEQHLKSEVIVKLHKVMNQLQGG